MKHTSVLSTPVSPLPCPVSGVLAVAVGPLRLVVLWHRGGLSAAWFHPTDPVKYGDARIGRA